MRAALPHHCAAHSVLFSLPWKIGVAVGEIQRLQIRARITTQFFLHDIQRALIYGLIYLPPVWIFFSTFLALALVTEVNYVRIKPAFCVCLSRRARKINAQTHSAA